jgi:sterol desaturase/sphingolipid hydroxylase (fatty acid hydroxylase superfamily)
MSMVSTYFSVTFGTLASLFVGDFIFYWYHRAQHLYPSLWVIHELHHADTELNTTTSLRTYFLEHAIQTIIISFPLIYVFGASRSAIISTPILVGFLFFTHANLRLDLGILTKIITGPQTHRIHHSIEEKHRDKNFAQFFPVIDIAFGTYYHPGRDEFPNTGTPMMKTNAPIGEVLLKPWSTWLTKLLG